MYRVCVRGNKEQRQKKSYQNKFKRRRSRKIKEQEI